MSRNEQTGGAQGATSGFNEQGKEGATTPGHGPQGVDKAPGEEASTDNVNFVAETQKGKQQVDADVDREEDRAKEEDI